MTQRKFIASLAAVVLSGVAAAALAAPQTLAVTILGPGGHSNGDYGNTNALHAGARAVLLIEKAVPTAMISDMKGGVSVNAIAADCHFLVTPRPPRYERPLTRAWPLRTPLEASSPARPAMASRSTCAPR